MMRRLLVFLASIAISAVLRIPVSALDIDCDYHSALLPYEFGVSHSRTPGDIPGLRNPLIPYRVAEDRGDSILIVYAYNTASPESNPAIVGISDYSRRMTLDDNPLYGTITHLELYTDHDLGHDAIGLTFRRDDSVFLARFIPLRDGFDELFLAAAGTAAIDDWNPTISIVRVEDYDFDGTQELFVHVNSGRAGTPNRLFCVDLSEHEIEWTLDLAGSIQFGSLLSCGDSLKPAVIFATYNPKHNIVNGEFTDLFCHLAKVTSDGNIEFNYLISAEHGGVKISERFSDSLFVLSHSLLRTDPADSLDPGPPRRRLSIFTVDGRVVTSTPIPGICRQVWRDDFDEDGRQNVYSLLSDGSLYSMDSSLQVVDSVGPTCLTQFIGRLQLPGMSYRTLFFASLTDVLGFDRNFNVIAELPPVLEITVLQSDETGAAEQVLGTGGDNGYILRVQEFGFWTRLHHWILRHENYVLSAIAVLLLAVVVSLIARQRAAEKSRVSERRAAATIRSSPDLVVRVNRDGIYLDAHAYDTDMLPVSVDQMIGKHIDELIEPPELRRELMTTVHEALRTRQLQIFEYDFAPRGEVRRYRAHVVAVGKDEIVATMRDITAEYRGRQELLRSEARFRKLIEKSPAAVLMHVENRIALTNQALSDLTGYTSEELLAMSPADLVAPEYQDVITDRMRARRDGFDFDQLFEVEAVTKQGQRRWVAYRAGVVPLDDMDTIMVVVHDISDRKAAEAQLAEATRRRFDQIRQVAGGLSHEIYNSLYPVRTSIEQLSRLLRSDQPPDLERVQRLLTLSESAINRAVSLTELVSRYSKIDQAVRAELVDLRRIVEEIEQQHLPTLSEHGVALFVDIASELPLYCSSDHMYSLLNNLIINAIDAVKERPRKKITVAAAHRNGRIEVRVADTGQGMSPTDKQRIFDPFFSTKPRTGTGLGLAVAQRIVDVWKGQISVESTIDKGTTFYIYLPIRTG